MKEWNLGFTSVYMRLAYAFDLDLLNEYAFVQALKK